MQMVSRTLKIIDVGAPASLLHTDKVVWDFDLGTILDSLCQHDSSLFVVCYFSEVFIKIRSYLSMALIMLWKHVLCRLIQGLLCLTSSIHLKRYKLQFPAPR